ncbi:MAG: DNA repair protein [Clostridiales bacterium]|nr:DNA repair protein [Clostridiales bacterium]
MKTFYASVECAERHLDPFETNLVVADTSHGENALCLAISPKLKAMGIQNRCRLNDIPRNVEYIAAPPRMRFYIDYAADIYALYLNWFDASDIHVYSIDESFIDATGYLAAYRMDGCTLAQKLMGEIAKKLHIPSTAGVGTNLYLAKIALDITAKRTKEHIGYLNEELYRETLWDHRPITDFWQIAGGTARRLAHYGIYTMRDVAACPEETLYKAFGVNAELLIDHAWGRESCRISDIKNYKTKSKSVSFSQILPQDYTFEKARLVIAEMACHGAQELMRRHAVAKNVWVGVGYSRELHGSTAAAKRLPYATALPSNIRPAVLSAYEAAALRDVPIRRLAVSLGDLCDENREGYDLFSDLNAMQREKSREQTVLELTQKYGKNAVLRGTNYMEGATQRERNKMIGGHRAGYDDTRAESETVHAF